MDEDPVADPKDLVGEQAHVDHAADAGHVHAGQVLVLIGELYDLSGDAKAHERSPLGAVLERFQGEFVATSHLHLQAAAGHAGNDALLVLAVLTAASATGLNWQQHQLGHGVLGNGAGGGDRERLLEGVRVDVVETAHPDLHPGHRPVTGARLHGVDDGAAQSELVHWSTSPGSGGSG